MNPNIPSLYYLIEGGQALELVQAHIRDLLATDAARVELIKEISKEAKVVEACRHIDAGTLIGVRFERGVQHPDFTKPRGRLKSCYPKKGTKWFARFQDQPRVETTPGALVDAYKIPLSMSYVKIEDGKQTSEGFRHIGWPPLNEVGFLYMGKDGPYGLWTPDIQAYVKDQESRGFKVTGACSTYDPDGLEGCRRIEKEEWEIIVAQHKLKEKKNATAPQ